MKLLFMLLWMAPSFGYSQKLKVNEYDKFIKQRRVEVEPLPVLATIKANISLGFLATGTTLFTSLNGFGWGASTIDAGNEIIFLFSNDSTVIVKSTSLQTYEATASGNNYKHIYYLTAPALEALSRYQLVGIRKYGFNNYNDLQVSKSNADKIKKLSALFMDELKKAKIIQTLKLINVKDITQHIGDSVQFTSRVFAARHYESSEKKPTVLDINNSYGQTKVNVVIWDDERKNFSKEPEQLYNNRDVCISGVVQLYNNIPQIVIHDKSQIKVTSPIHLNEVAYFIGDTMTVSGKVFSAKYFSTSQSAPTLFNLGAAYPDQLCTVVIENKDRKNFIANPEAFYNDKDITVTGKITLYNHKPQIVITDKEQIKVKDEDEIKFTKSESNAAKSDVVLVKETKETTAQFPGGSEAWLSFLKVNLKCPVLVEGEEKAVMARFLVSPRGDISNIEIVKSAGKLFDNEVVRVLKKMPLWNAQTLNGKPIGSVITQKFTFKATEDGQESIKIF